MAILPVVYPPPLWSNQDIVLYHGTIDSFAAAIMTAVHVSAGKPHRDFGPGFYTTTVLPQAHMWAAEIAAGRPGTLPAVIEFTVPREALAPLGTLAFIRGDFHADDFWSFVHYCRGGATDHGRPSARGYYDIVYGPVAAFWNQRMIIANADQISFHTSAAEAVLNHSLRRRII
jgi:Protein of unknown function (DUF3990)